MAKNKEIALNGGQEMTAQQRLEQKKKKKRRKTVRIVVLSIVGTLILLMGSCIYMVSRTMKKMAGSTVTLSQAERGDIDANVVLNGTLASDKTMNYSAPASVRIGKVVPVGTYVKKGELILQFDEEELAQALHVAELNEQIALNSYKSQLASINNSRKKLADARARYAKYAELVLAQQAVVDEVTKDADERSIRQMEIQAAITSLQSTLGKLDPTNPDDVKKGEDIQKQINSLQSELNGLTSSKSSYYFNKNQQAQIQSLAEHKANRDTAEAEIKQYEASLLDTYALANIDLNGELAQIQARENVDAIAAYVGGLRAPFDGVVTMVGFTEGDKAMMGSPVISFSSLEDVHINLSVGKSDLEKIEEGQEVAITMLKNEYHGKITTINHSAMQTGTAGAQVMVTVSVDDPDENLYLGLDAKCSILTASVKDVLMLPVEAVNIDSIGEFVFTFDTTTMIVGKKYVTTGANSELFVEIKDGIDENDVIIVSYTGVVEEGKMATPSQESMGYVNPSLAK